MTTLSEVGEMIFKLLANFLTRVGKTSLLHSQCMEVVQTFDKIDYFQPMESSNC